MIDLIIIVIYFSIMLFVGWRSRLQSAESYWVAGRRYNTGKYSGGRTPGNNTYRICAGVLSNSVRCPLHEQR